MSEPADVAATRTAYDIVAADYASMLSDELTSKPYDRAVLSLFAELVRDSSAPVVDIGCGPGRIAAHLHGLGVDVFGIDLSPEMVAVARRAFGHLRFDVGSMLELKIAASSVSGVIAWYSIIHTPPTRLGQVFAEFHRIVQRGGVVLLAFQVGDERRRIEHAYGHAVSLDAYRLWPEAVGKLAIAAGFSIEATLTRAPDAAEKVAQAFVVLRKRATLS